VAQNLEQMVFFRILQGLGGAFLSPLAQTVTLDSSTAAERPRMMGLYTQGVMLGPITGPIIGGFLTDNYNWRWVFYVNLPVGLICFLLLWLYLPKTPTR
jgi:DHA2 family multidrug resistance protein